MKTLSYFFLVTVTLLPAMEACGTKPNSEPTEQEIVVKFKPEAEPAQVDEMEAQVGLEQIDEVSALDIKVYKVASQKTVAEAIRACTRRPFVEYAEPNLKYRTQK